MRLYGNCAMLRWNACVCSSFFFIESTHIQTHTDIQTQLVSEEVSLFIRITNRVTISNDAFKKNQIKFFIRSLENKKYTH